MTKKTSAPVCMIFWMAPPRASPTYLNCLATWRGTSAGSRRTMTTAPTLFQPKAYETPMRDTVTTWWTCISQKSLRLCSMRQETMPWA